MYFVLAFSEEKLLYFFSFKSLIFLLKSGIQFISENGSPQK